MPKKATFVGTFILARLNKDLISALSERFATNRFVILNVNLVNDTYDLWSCKAGDFELDSGDDSLMVEFLKGWEAGIAR